jgi:hypothetical protein
MLSTGLTEVNATGTFTKKCLCRFCTAYLNIKLPIVYTLPARNFLDKEKKKCGLPVNSTKMPQVTPYSLHAQPDESAATYKTRSLSSAKGSFVKFLSSP